MGKSKNVYLWVVRDGRGHKRGEVWGSTEREAWKAVPNGENRRNLYGFYLEIVAPEPTPKPTPKPTPEPKEQPAEERVLLVVRITEKGDSLFSYCDPLRSMTKAEIGLAALLLEHRVNEMKAAVYSDMEGE